MMYNFLVNATKNRIILELEDFYSRHPVFKNLKITNRFPFIERVQEGVIVKNSSANKVPLSADNFQGNVFSYTTLANHSNFPGTSIEWVREDNCHIANRTVRESYSNQFTVRNNIINLSSTMHKSSNDLTFADQHKNVEVYVNNQKVYPKLVNGKDKIIILQHVPPINSTVEVSYWSRNLAPSGIYQVEIIEGDTELHKFKFMVDSLLNKEVTLIQKSTGMETSAQLPNFPIYPKSLKLKENDEYMSPNIDYIVDETSGIITFFNNPLKNSKIEAFYRVQGLSTGPFEIPYFNYGHNTAIPGIVLAFGRGVQVGDKQFVIINKERELTALEYSGKWEMSISLDVYAKDSYRIEEIIDLTTSHLWVFRKEELDAEGIAFVDVNFSGESETVFDEGTGDLYYMGSIDYNLLTEWIMHKPLLQTIDGFDIFVNEIKTPAPFPVGKTRSFENIK
jgi:hypothetical protein